MQDPFKAMEPKTSLNAGDVSIKTSEEFQEPNIPLFNDSFSELFKLMDEQESQNDIS